MAELLIAAGADVNAKNYQDETALDYTNSLLAVGGRRNRRPPPQTRRQDV